MTRGSRRTSSGPFGDFFPVIEDVNSVRDPHNHAHVVLDQQHSLDVIPDEILE
jgi:hypothetical protein